MNALIISNRLTKTSSNSDVELYQWTLNRPSAENYEVVILDLYFDAPSTDGYAELSGEDHNFYEIGPEIVRCLRAGGVVVATLGPVAVNDKELHDKEDYSHTLKRRRDGHTNRYKHNHESSYDWLDQGFLNETMIDALNKKRSSNLSILAKWEEVEKYFHEVKDFWTVIDGCDIYSSPTKCTLTHSIEEVKRWDILSSVSQHDAWIIAVSSHTREPVAVAMNYLMERGLLVLVPPFYISRRGSNSNLARSPKIERILIDFAYCIKEKVQRFDSPDVPDWAIEHRPPRVAEIASKIDDYQVKMDDMREKLVTYDKMLYLLFGKGELLEQQVYEFFCGGGEGVLVERTGKGSSLDLFVKDQSGRSLAVEVTGTKGKLTKSDSHWADFLDYLPEHYEKNERGRTERIVLVVNTYCDVPIDKRQREDDITKPVLNIARDNHICIIRSCDLYELWGRMLEGFPLQKVFDSLFICDGLFNLATLLNE